MERKVPGSAQSAKGICVSAPRPEAEMEQEQPEVRHL